MSVRARDRSPRSATSLFSVSAPPVPQESESEAFVAWVRSNGTEPPVTPLAAAFALTELANRSIDHPAMDSRKRVAVLSSLYEGTLARTIFLAARLPKTIQQRERELPSAAPPAEVENTSRPAPNARPPGAEQPRRVERDARSLLRSADAGTQLVLDRPDLAQALRRVSVPEIS